MRLSRNTADAALLTTLLYPFLALATNISCKQVVVDGISFNLEKLGGPRSVMNSLNEGASSFNTTYTIDICQQLKPKDNKSGNRCEVGTWLCAIKRLIKNETDEFIDAFPIAGSLENHGGGSLDSKWTLLRKSTSNEGSKKEGLSLEMHGGYHKIGEKTKSQKAVVEFICDREREGLENLLDPEDKYESPKSRREEGEKKDEGPKDDKDSPSLQFDSYDTRDEKIDVLRLNWRTKYACENSKGEQDAEKKASWGFFTWFILIAFLSTATYLIFGSWLNYNRYGARGWDLLPHGDTIRDVPYLLKDWSRRVVSSVQGGGSRGGYAAV